MALAPEHQQSSSNQAEATTKAAESELSENELDSYIISVPNLKKQRKAIKKSVKEGRDPKHDEHGYLPSTPKRKKSTAGKLNEAGLLTPQSLGDASPAKSTIPEEDFKPETPRKNFGWFGTDARVWSAQGYKSPCKGSPWPH